MKLKIKLDDLSALDASSKTCIDTDFLAEIAIGLWRLKRSLLLEIPTAIDIKTKRAWKHLERLFAHLESREITIQDKTGEPYDAGMSLRVVSAEQRTDLSRELIVETITPTVFCRENIIHAGEVIVGKPATKNP
jgi:hypothetical protein